MSTEESTLLTDRPNDGKDNTRTETLSIARRLLYASHLFAQFSDASWQFCLTLFLAAFTNYDSLFLVSTYGLVSGLTVCYLGGMAGQFIDQHNRLFTAQVFIGSQNACVLLATLFSYFLLARNLPTTTTTTISSSILEEDDGVYPVDSDTTSFQNWWVSRLEGVPLDPVSVFLLVGIHILGSFASILSSGFLVAIERDWIVVMSHLAGRDQPNTNDSTTVTTTTTTTTEWLAETNVALKQIDLSCKVVSPAVAGFVIAAFNTSSELSELDNHGKDLRGAALLVGLLNGAALIVEYVCTKQIYEMIPALGESSMKKEADSDNTEEGGSTVEMADGSASEKQESVGCGSGFFRLPRGLQIYMDQSISWGGIGFALLYLNALTFGTLMTAYLVWRGMRFGTIGVWRGISSAIGLMGTFVYHFSTQHLTIESTGMWSICFQFTALSISYASLFVPDAYYMTSLSMLIGGVCASRVGLWVFDISITQLFQELVPPGVRGVTGGVQQSLNAFFGMLAYVLGIFFPDPKEFYLYVAAGYASVGISMVMYLFSIFLRKDQLRGR